MNHAVRLIAMLGVMGAVSASAQVQSIGNVSFAVPDGWRYQAGRDFGSMVAKADSRYWTIAVYTAMPSSGDPNTDFKGAWKRVVLAGPGYNGLPPYDPYDITQTVGYPGKYNDGSSVDRKSYTRLYVLETGKSCIPVAFVSSDRLVLDGMEHNARAVAGSVRLAPLRASPIQYTVHIADLVGHWTNGIASTIAYYNPSGQHQGNSVSALRTEYIISADGRYTTKSVGLINNRSVNDDDSGVIELGGAFITFKGQRHVRKNRFMNLQQAIDGSMVMTLWPPLEMTQISPMRDSSYWTRIAKK